MPSHEHERHGIARSPHWRTVERAHLQIEPHCMCCLQPADHAVQVHHVFPFHYVVALGRPDLELDHRNLITLCETEKGRPAPNHHLLVGHLDDFKTANLRVQWDAGHTFHGWDDAFIKGAPQWQVARAAKLTPLDEMSEHEKKEFRSVLDQVLPRAP